ncbi:hypothetical protein Tco_1426155 [Tanacetum coccineum]
MNERKMQTQEGKVDMVKALDVGLVITKISGTISAKQNIRSKSWNGCSNSGNECISSRNECKNESSNLENESSNSGNDTDADYDDIKPTYDKEPLEKVHLNDEYDVFANEK